MPQALQRGVPSSASLHMGVFLVQHDAQTLPPSDSQHAWVHHFWFPIGHSSVNFSENVFSPNVSGESQFANDSCVAAPPGGENMFFFK